MASADRDTSTNVSRTAAPRTPWKWPFSRLKMLAMAIAPTVLAALLFLLGDSRESVSFAVAFAVPSLVLLCLTIWAYFLRPLATVVGTDGILVQRPYGWRSRYIPFERINGVRITTETGKRYNVRFVSVMVDTTAGPIEVLRDFGSKKHVVAQDLSELIANRENKFDQRADSPQSTELNRFEQARRPVASEWLRELRRMPDPDPYRKSEIPGEVLTSWVDNHELGLATRAAAALAADRKGGDEGRRRLRIAADTLANPRSRQQLLRIATADDDEEIAQALEELAHGESAVETQK